MPVEAPVIRAVPLVLMGSNSFENGNEVEGGLDAAFQNAVGQDSVIGEARQLQTAHQQAEQGGGLSADRSGIGGGLGMAQQLADPVEIGFDIPGDGGAGGSVVAGQFGGERSESAAALGGVAVGRAQIGADIGADLVLGLVGMAEDALAGVAHAL